VYNANFPEGEWRTGGFIGCIFNNATVSNCSATSSINSLGDCAGFVAFKKTTGTISNCRAYATIKTRNYATMSGGFVFANEGSGLIDGCLFVGSIENESLIDEFIDAKVGGFAGKSWAKITNSAAIATIDNRITTDRVWGTGGFVGALNDEGTTNGTLENCYFSGSVKGNGIVGGLIGFSNTIPGTAEIRNCYSHATVEATGTAGGGLVGIAINASPAITNAYFTGSVTAQTGVVAGSFAGYLENEVVLSNCVTQTIDGLENIGGSDEGTVTVPSFSAGDVKKQSAYPATWFSNGWQIKDGQTCPYFSGQSAPVTITALNANTIKGSLFNAAETVSVFTDKKPKAATVSLNGLNWSADFTEPVQENTPIAVLNNETGKMVSYPVEQAQFLTALPGIQAAQAVSVYVDSKGNLYVNAPVEIRKVELFSLSGAAVANDVSTLAKGVYIVKVTSVQGVSAHKIIKR
jgi:hypothetical protein